MKIQVHIMCDFIHNLSVKTESLYQGTYYSEFMVHYTLNAPMTSTFVPAKSESYKMSNLN